MTFKKYNIDYRMTAQRYFLPVIFLILLAAMALLAPSGLKTNTEAVINGADTAWMLTATALVLLMTPGLAFFYGGMVNKKNVISTMFQSFISMAVITVLWVVVGFSLSFGESVHGIVGNPRTFFMMNGLLDGNPWPLAPTIPLALYAFFQLKFAIITPTYSGCPAMDVIGINIRLALSGRGFSKIKVEMQLSPAWTTDWMTATGKQRLKEYGIAPPQRMAKTGLNLFDEDVVPCPRCDSQDTVLVSNFAATACKSLYKCNACHEPFEHFKCH
jgi:phenylacetate-CoA oxygenase PaaJ subunit